MTKPNTKHSSVFSGPTRQKAQSPIHKLSEVSKISGSSPLHIKAMVRAHYIKNPPSLFNLAEAALSKITSEENASTKLDQVSNKLKSVLNDLDNVNISPETSLNSEQEVAGVSTDLSESLFKNFSIEELNLLSESLSDDSSEQTISGQEAIDDADIS